MKATRSLLIAATLILLPTLSFADSMDGFSPLSSDRFQQLDQNNRNYEMQRNYGLLDRDSESGYVRGYNDQKGAFFNEILNHESSTQGTALKTNIQANVGDTTVTRSAFLLGSVYVLANGKPVKARIADETELSVSAKATDRAAAVGLSSKNVTPLNLTSAMTYRMDPLSQSMDASLTREVVPHVSAAIDQRRTVLPGNAPVNESTGTLRYGINF